MIRTIALVAWFVTTSFAGADDKLRDEAKQAFGILKTSPSLDLGAADVTLGRALFWDERLSANGKVACASCHRDAGADSRPFSLDARGKLTTRNSQTVFNAMLQPALRWVGDRKSGAHQAEKSLTGSLGFAAPEAVTPLLKKLDYESAFKSAFPADADPASPSNYAKALQAYQATLVTPAPLDRYLAGDDAALTPPQKIGLKVFMRVGCADCHKGPLLGGTSLKKFGVKSDYWSATRSEKQDAGLFDVSKDEADRYKFRVSMLRNIAKTGPYFHDGSVVELKEAVQVMAQVQLGARLSDANAASIVSFLESLTGDTPAHYSPPK